MDARKRTKMILSTSVISLLAIAIAVAAIFLISATASTEESVVQEAAEKQLSVFEETGVFKQKVISEVNQKIYYEYRGNRTGNIYSFDVEGRLSTVWGSQGGAHLDEATTMLALQSGELDAIVLEYADKAIEMQRFGELEIVSVTMNNGIATYELREMHGEVPTGTRIGGTWLQDGTLVNVTICYGEVFHGIPSGAKKEPGIQISEDQAISIAMATVEERIAGTGYRVEGKPATCKLDANRGDLFYAVSIDTYSEAEDYVVTYTVRISSENGKVLETEYTQ